MKNSSYADVYTVSTEEVVEYVLKNGIPESELTRKNHRWKFFTLPKRTANGTPISMKE